MAAGIGSGRMLKISQLGTRVTSGASAHTAIPNDASGGKAKWVLLTGIGLVYVLPSLNSGTVTTSAIPLPANVSILMDVSGFSHIGSVQSSAAEVFVITPVDQIA